MKKCSSWAITNPAGPNSATRRYCQNWSLPWLRSISSTQSKRCLRQRTAGRARRDNESFGWDDLPGTDAMKRQLDARLGGALRFAVWWRYRVEPTIEKRGIFGGHDGPKWLEKLSDGIDWQSSTPEMRENMEEYSRLLLDWAGSMQLFSKSRIDDVSLSGYRPNSEPLRAAKSGRSARLAPQSQRRRDARRSYQSAFPAVDVNDPPVSARVVFNNLPPLWPSAKAAAWVSW